MQRSRNEALARADREFAPVSFAVSLKGLWVVFLAGLVFLTACGGGTSILSQGNGPLSGNWQFTLQNAADGSFVGMTSPSCASPQGVPPPLCSGGFLLESTGPVTGGMVYSVSFPGQPKCSDSSGSAPVTGNLNGQTVNLTVPAGAQTFTLQGTLSTDGATMMGKYSVTDGQGCGTAQSGLQWKAILVPSLTGPVQGSFHSTAGGPLNNQDFAVNGTLTQGNNIGASNATITGMLTFPSYPCLTTASVNGQISGSSVVLQIIGSNGLPAGEIGKPVGVSAGPAVFESAGGGYVLHGAATGAGGNGYVVNTKPCSTSTHPPDFGNLCLQLGTATACTEPILLSPASISFPPQPVGSFPTTQTITLTNTDPSGSTLNGLQINPSTDFTTGISGHSDFSGLPNFTEQDNCAPPGSTFSLAPQHSCSITISFSPQQSCPWIPSGSPASSLGASPSSCPFLINAQPTLAVVSPKSATEDGDKMFAVAISGTGLSAIVPSTPELDFGSEAPSERSPSQLLSFTNQGLSAIQILPAAIPCTIPPNGNPVPLPRPLLPGVISGLQVDAMITADAGQQTIFYTCDYDLAGKESNFQISQDTCTGRLLAPQSSCSVEVTYVPQPDTYKVEPLNGAGLDYFLELNTLQCSTTTTSSCEVDSGRFPVELKANSPSPLRMSPAAGLDFGIQPRGQTSSPLTITLFNDPKDPNSQTVNFTGNLVKGDYAETDDCGASLAPGSSCTLTITFAPTVVGFDPGTLTISYTVQLSQFVVLRGTGQ